MVSFLSCLSEAGGEKKNLSQPSYGKTTDM